MIQDNLYSEITAANTQLAHLRIDQSPTLQNMPPEVIGIIMVHLNRITGTLELINKPDIPVICRYIGHLSRTCRELYQKVTSPQAVGLFITDMATRFKMDRMVIAARLNTCGARTLLSTHLEKNPDYHNAYQVILHIQEVAKKIVANKKVALPVDLPLSTGPDSGCQITRTGIFFSDSHVLPIYMTTPFGLVQIFKNIHVNTETSNSINQAFIIHLNASYEVIDNDMQYRIHKVFNITLKNPETIPYDESGMQQHFANTVLEMLGAPPPIKHPHKLDWSTLPETKPLNSPFTRLLDTVAWTIEILKELDRQELAVCSVQNQETTIKTLDLPDDPRRFFIRLVDLVNTYYDRKVLPIGLTNKGIRCSEPFPENTAFIAEALTKALHDIRHHLTPVALKVSPIFAINILKKSTRFFNAQKKTTDSQISS